MFIFALMTMLCVVLYTVPQRCTVHITRYYNFGTSGFKFYIPARSSILDSKLPHCIIFALEHLTTDRGSWIPGFVTHNLQLGSTVGHVLLEVEPRNRGPGVQGASWGNKAPVTGREL
ncbi:hypothetical protein BC826DRAFT_1034611 [Russula brevipes]|nr:hypothetical protein BC826DRAFT_1034611 [Russula brevipes]